MPEYMIIVSTKEEETISSLSDAIADSVYDFLIEHRIDPDYLAVDEAREAKDEDDFHVAFQRTA